MVSRIRIGPEGGPFVEIDEDNGTLKFDAPSGDIDLQANDLLSLGDLDIENKGNPDFTLNTQTIANNIGVSNKGDLFFIHDDTENINQILKFDLSTTYDISTASLDASFDSFGDNEIATCFDFADGGEKLYENNSNAEMVQYDLNEPYDLASATESASLAANTNDGPGDPAFSPDGLQLTFGHRGDNNIVSFDLSTPFDIGTASNKKSFSGTPDDDPSCLKWNADGTKAFVRHASPDMVNQFITTTPYSVDGMSFDKQFFDNPEFVGGGHEFNYGY